MAERFTLFYNDYSICSIMVRFTIAVANQAQSAHVIIDEQPVDIQHGGQLSEFYLCEVNPKGTVPVLKGSKSQLEAALTESLEITYFLAEQYPSLFPNRQIDQIKTLLAELHDINYFSLTYTHKPQRAADMENAVHQVLADPKISNHYRSALEYKLKVIRATRAPALTKEMVETQENKALAFLSQIEELLAASETGKDERGTGGAFWIFGTTEATALDAHLVPFIARLVDVGRGSMLSGKNRVLAYAERAWETHDWKQVMQGRKTVYGTYL
ncbi:hypothetical protein H2200_006425 [Cladophialophora chaetospira]|uniref:GST N-terminal domain-containing protein n=1 Tax=Cladophialophora chaetospira TaxID=386627 RepID=A0AA39CHV3_9EURO|nr:hypothetical protein H2200_006425 [Cladophialophora chaetospira]